MNDTSGKASGFRRQTFPRIPHRSAPPLTKPPVHIDNARVLTLGWHVIKPGVGILVNSEVAHAKWLVQRGASETVAVKYPRTHFTVPKSCILLGGYDNYYHHMVDYIFNFYYIDRGPKLASLPYLTLELNYPFQREIVAHLGVSLRDLIPMPPLSVVKCCSLIVIPHSFRKFGQALDPEVFAWIRERFVKGRYSGNKSRRIYISRRTASRRRVCNEDEVMKLLAARGFEEIVLEKRSFSDQVEIFSEADIIVGAHGAGLTNIVFSRPGSTVIELTPEDIEPARRFFDNLSLGAGQQFLRVLGSKGFHRDEFSVPVHELEKRLNETGIH